MSNRRKIKIKTEPPPLFLKFNQAAFDRLVEKYGGDDDAIPERELLGAFDVLQLEQGTS